VPTLVLPPQAGHASSIVDYGRGQSQMMTLRDAGLDHLFAIDWVDCPIFLLAGTKDHITPPEQVWALADLVSTPAEHIARELVDAGHLGLFMGRAALAEHWTPIAERVRVHSAGGA
jgi:poly(3-hydroxyalkanoate) synthetase